MKFIKLFFSILTFAVACNCMQAQVDSFSLVIELSDFESNEGKVYVGLYNAEETWLLVPWRGSRERITNKKCIVTFENIPSGVYAISAFHDKDNNGKLDKNFLGIPSESYACSNGAVSRFGPPSWSDAIIKIQNDTKINIKF